MDKKTIQLIILFTLIDNQHCFANLSQEGQSFGGTLLDKQNAQSLNEKVQSLPGLKAYQQGGDTPENASKLKALHEIQNSFNSNFDQGFKNRDPIKSDLAKINNHKLQSQHSNEPSLNQTTELLRQKHRWQLDEGDPVFRGHNLVSNPTQKHEKENASIKEKQEEIKLVNEIITCKEGTHPIHISCTKRLILTPLPQPIFTQTITAKVASHGKVFNYWWMAPEMTFSIDLKNGKVSCSNQHVTPNISIDKHLINIDDSEKTEVELVSRINHGDGWYDLTLVAAPSHANHYVATFKSLEYNWWWRHRAHQADFTWKFTIQPKPKLTEHWEGCELEEQRSSDKYCSLSQATKTGVNETRIISGYPDSVKRDYWEEERVYHCGFKTDSTCEPLRKKGCEQIASKCLKVAKDHCLEFEQTYQCSQQTLHNKPVLVDHDFLKSQKEHSDMYNPGDFGEAITGFSALTEMSKRMNGLGGIGGDQKNPSVFNGECQRCSIKLGAAFQNCCDLTGMALGLFGGCREGEKKLAVAAVKDKRCHKVQDKYCTTKILNKCVEEKEAYCCFGSQLGKIIQEIAHDQLGISWGSGESPNCGSLTAEQLSKLNFDTPFARSKLAEVLNEYQATAQDKYNRVDAQLKNVNVNQKIDTLQKSLSKHFSKEHPTRVEAPQKPELKGDAK